jgi:hypothetical protein
MELGAVVPPMKLHDVITPSTGTTNWLFGETPWNQLVFWLQALPAGLIVWPTWVAAPAVAGTAVTAIAAIDEINRILFKVLLPPV